MYICKHYKRDLTYNFGILFQIIGYYIYTYKGAIILHLLKE